MGVETQVNQDSTEQKGEQTNLLILKCAVQGLAPSSFFPSQAQTHVCTWCQAKLSTHGQPGITKACGDSPRASTPFRGSV